jgi:hypothetical protein
MGNTDCPQVVLMTIAAEAYHAAKAVARPNQPPASEHGTLLLLRVRNMITLGTMFGIVEKDDRIVTLTSMYRW